MYVSYEPQVVGTQTNEALQLSDVFWQWPYFQTFQLMSAASFDKVIFNNYKLKFQ